MKGLCGQLQCKRLCPESQYCPLGQARVRKLLAQQRERREARRLQRSRVGQSIEAAIPVFAGSFAAFQHQLKWERQQLAEEQIAVDRSGRPGRQAGQEVDQGFTYQEYLENYKESEAAL